MAKDEVVSGLLRSKTKLPAGSVDLSTQSENSSENFKDHA